MSNQSSMTSLEQTGKGNDSNKVSPNVDRTKSKLNKQALAYEKMLIKLESDIRQHIRVE